MKRGKNNKKIIHIYKAFFRPGGKSHTVRSYFFPGFFFVAILAAGLVFTFSRSVNFTTVPDAGFISGEWMSRYQQRYESEPVLRNFARHTWGFIRYFFFHEGWPGVLAGEEDWLFSSEEFSYYPAADSQTAFNLVYVQSVYRRLAGLHIGLIVAVIPDKARIYSERLGRYRYPVYVRERYRTFWLGLTAHGILAPDLAAALLTAKKQEQVWMRTDTHWSASGARVAAQVLAAVCRPLLVQYPDIPRNFFRLETPDRELYEGDLTRFIPLGPFRKFCRLQPEWAGTQEAVLLPTGNAPAGAGLFSKPKIPVVLVGTSFSAGKKWAFDAALQYYLEVDMLNVAKEGEGPFLPMQTYLDSDTFRELSPVLVIWEIPERFLPVAYPDLRMPWP